MTSFEEYKWKDVTSEIKLQKYFGFCLGLPSLVLLVIFSEQSQLPYGELIVERALCQGTNVSHSGRKFRPTSSPYCVGDEFLSHVWLFVTPWTAALQTSFSFTVSWS